MINDSFSWPDEKGELFKADDWWNNAPIDVCFFGYINGYKIAADLLVDHIYNVIRTDQNFLVYPICFLYRHYLELQFKDFISYCNIALNNKEKYPEHHDLEKIWEHLRSSINELTENFGEGMWGPDIKKELDIIGHYVNQFCAVDKQSVAFRYPYSKKQGKRKAKLKNEEHLAGITHIDLKNLCDHVEKIYNFFLGVSSIVFECINNNNIDCMDK